jgi:hypothetical protein
MTFPPYQRVGKTIKQIVDASIKPLAKSAGFRKKHYTFFRRRESLLQVVNVQSSIYNFGVSGGFFINTGIAVDALRLMEGKPIVEELKEYECHLRHRIEDYFPSAPQEWKITPTTDMTAMINLLREAFKVVIDEFNAINSIEDIISRNKWGRGSDYILLARLHYAIDQLDKSREYLQLAADFFHDRPGVSVSRYIERYHLHKLAE